MCHHDQVQTFSFTQQEEDDVIAFREALTRRGHAPHSFRRPSSPATGRAMRSAAPSTGFSAGRSTRRHFTSSLPSSSERAPTATRSGTPNRSASLKPADTEPQSTATEARDRGGASPSRSATFEPGEPGSLFELFDSLFASGDNRLSVVSGYAVEDLRVAPPSFAEPLGLAGAILNGNSYEGKLIEGPVDNPPDFRILSPDGRVQL